MAKIEKIENINVRVTREVKQLAELAAAADDRSLTTYIAALIRADATKRGLKAGR